MDQYEDFLVKKLKNSDEAAFKILYMKYFPKIYYFVKQYLIQHGDAENTAQDTFLILWNKRFDLKPDTKLAPFLFTVAKNNCLQILRKRKNQLLEIDDIRRIEIESNLDALNDLNTSTIDFYEIDKIINETLLQLPPKSRDIFLLSRFEEKKNREIAEELNISIKTVEFHINKALILFKRNLKEYIPIIAYLLIDPR